VQVGHATTCTATVTDAGPDTPSTPTGTVDFSSNGPGAFSGGGSCTLSGGGSSASCDRTYTPSTAGPQTITATYDGVSDPDHTGSADSTTITAYNALGGGKATCDGIFAGTAKDVVVPRGAHCTLLAGANVTHDVHVQRGGSLDDQGANVGHDVNGDHPEGIGIRGGAIGHNVLIDGVTGAGPGAGGDNFICDTNVGGSVEVKKGLASAGAFVIGDPPDCSGHPSNTIGGSLKVESNANHVDVSENHVGNDMQVKNNTGGAVVSDNQVTGDATCQGNNPPATGSGNTAHRNRGCPA
jgi:hypothetical protein